MKIERYVPSDGLKPFIKAFTIIESDFGMENRILPDTSIVMAFRYRGSVAYTNDSQQQLPTSVITGIRNSSRLVGYSRDAATLLVLFKAGGSAAFIKQPLHELFETSLSLGNFLPGHQLAAIEEQLADAPTNGQRVALLERFLFSQLRQIPADRLILQAAQKIVLANGGLRIKALARAFNISQDPFEKRFRRVIGSTPKQFSRIVRLRNLIGTYSNAKSFTQTAYEAGYFDQAHFIKDFKSFTGQTPQHFFKAPAYW